MKGTNASHFNKCFAFDVLLRSSKDDTHQHLYNTISSILNICVADSAKPFVSSLSLVKSETRRGSLELVNGSATDYFDNIKLRSKIPKNLIISIFYTICCI